MKVIKAEQGVQDQKYHSRNGTMTTARKTFDPMSIDGKKMRCVCGYELVKQDDNTLRCTGGNHVYRISESQVFYDKFGNILLEMPELNPPKPKKVKK